MATVNIFQHTEHSKTFTAGEVIFRQGEPGEVMYVIEEGEVDLWVKEQFLETAGPGNIFGEMALLDSSERNISAVARTNCRVVPLNQTRFKVYIHHTPYFAIQVMRIMADRLSRMS
ncbi:MAG: cyclic nucleotide-binding domain-containing protein [Anaerolineae bacterium]|nr:cyclic nucleotide-binding domain-containing protein [Anaerolineae bacterium]